VLPAALRAPTATDSPEDHADWLEVRALLADDGNSSITDLMRALRPTGTVEEVVDEGTEGDAETAAELSDPGDDWLEAVVSSASGELDDRLEACGCEPAYPFRLGEQYLQSLPEAPRSVYVFLLLLSVDGINAGPADLSATELFEDISAVAAEGYFGGTACGVQLYQFGFPRRRTLPGFVPALDDLCSLLGEGGGARKRPDSRYQKDAKLDLVVWRPFPDARSGKIVGFGQCAAGADWREKLSELDPRAFTGLWMTDRLAVEPTPLFFCPFRVERARWETAAFHSGVLFDRCRIALHTGDAPDDLVERCEQFTGHVLDARRARA
jgi:hypothetical protein